MLGKIVSGAVGSTVASKAGKSGALGAVAGLVFNRIIKRSPATALLVGGAMIARKLSQRAKERKALELANRPSAHGPVPTLTDDTSTR